MSDNPKTDAQRTILQNKSLHLYLRELSQGLNDGGFDAKKVLKPEVSIPWDRDGVMAKNLLWRPVQEIVTGIESTTDLSTKQMQAIYQIIDRHIAEKFGVQVEWPSEERMKWEQAERAAG